MKIKILAIVFLLHIKSNATITFKNNIKNSTIVITQFYLKQEFCVHYLNKGELYNYDKNKDVKDLLFIEITIYKSNKVSTIGQIRFNSITKKFNYISLIKKHKNNITDSNWDGKTIIFQLDDNGKIMIIEEIKSTEEEKKI